MERTEIGKPKICGVPRQNSRLLLLSAVLLILSGAAMLALRVGFAEQESVDRLFPQLAAILFVVTGGLLFFCRRRTELFVPVACVLTAAMCSGNDFAVKFATLAAFAALLLLVSAVGLRANVSFSALPKLPVFNLISAALFLQAALAGMTRCDYDFSALYQRQPWDFSAAELPSHILAEDLETCGAKYFLYAFNMRSDAPQYQNAQLYFLWNQASSPYLERHLRDISTWNNRLPRGDRNDPRWQYYYLFDENRELIGYTKLSSGDRPGGV